MLQNSNSMLTTGKFFDSLCISPDMGPTFTTHSLQLRSYITHKLSPIPIASDATNTLHSSSGSLNLLSCSIYYAFTTHSLQLRSYITHKLSPIPIASDATNTLHSSSGSLNLLSCSILVARMKETVTCQLLVRLTMMPTATTTLQSIVCLNHPILFHLI